jgi:hypothetical protein
MLKIQNSKMGLGAGPLWPCPQPHFLIFFCQLYVGCLYVHVIRQVFIRWEALYVLTLYVLTLYIGKHYMLGSFIRSDVIHSDVIRSVFIRSDVIRSDIIRSVIIRSVGESIILRVECSYILPGKNMTMHQILLYRREVLPMLGYLDRCALIEE